MKRAALWIPPILIIGALLWLYGKPAQTYQVTLGGGGFSPARLVVERGAHVRFSSTDAEAFWPASDPHPLHDQHPVFDPQRPLQPSETWEFTFSENGVYAYHDHLHPERRGVIVVGSDSDIIAAVRENACGELADTERRRVCWDGVFQKTLREKGLDDGFKLFRMLAELEPADCHQYAHDLGAAAYDTKSFGADTALGQETSFCGFGFWHGFMNELSVKEGLPAAKSLCDSITATTALLTDELRLNCYHGIGIGLIPDPPAPGLWGNVKALLEPAVAYCSQIGTNVQADNCYSGAFHGVVEYMAGKQYGFTFDADNPFGFCDAWSSGERANCYYQVAPKLAGYVPDVKKGWAMLSRLDHTLKNETALLALTNYADTMTSEEQYTDFVVTCSGVADTMTPLCVGGIVRNIFKTGEPGREYVRAVHFCSSEKLDTSLSRGCFEQLYALAERTYPPETIREMCSAFPAREHDICV